jgi:hypothetical protein
MADPEPGELSFTVILAGHGVSTGGSTSATVTVKEQLAELPIASVTVQVTVVVPLGNVEPVAGLHIGEPRPGQLSLTAGAGKFTTAEH